MFMHSRILFLVTLPSSILICYLPYLNEVISTINFIVIIFFFFFRWKATLEPRNYTFQNWISRRHLRLRLIENKILGCKSLNA